MSLANVLMALIEIGGSIIEYFVTKPEPDRSIYINVLESSGEIFSTRIYPYNDEFNLAAKHGKPIAGCFYDPVGMLVLCYINGTTNDLVYSNWKYVDAKQ